MPQRRVPACESPPAPRLIGGGAVAAVASGIRVLQRDWRHEAVTSSWHCHHEAVAAALSPRALRMARMHWLMLLSSTTAAGRDALLRSCRFVTSSPALETSITSASIGRGFQRHHDSAAGRQLSSPSIETKAFGRCRRCAPRGSQHSCTRIHETFMQSQCHLTGLRQCPVHVRRLSRRTCSPQRADRKVLHENRITMKRGVLSACATRQSGVQRRWPMRWLSRRNGDGDVQPGRGCHAGWRGEALRCAGQVAASRACREAGARLSAYGDSHGVCGKGAALSRAVADVRIDA